MAGPLHFDNLNTFHRTVTDLVRKPPELRATHHREPRRGEHKWPGPWNGQAKGSVGLWVERGVIWWMEGGEPWVIGFVDQHSMKAFMRHVQQPGAITPYQSFTRYDLPNCPMVPPDDIAIVRVGHGGPPSTLMMWPKISMMPYMSMVFATLTLAPYDRPLSEAGPCLPLSGAKHFQAASPDGVRTFSADYLCYSAIGPNHPSMEETWFNVLN